MASQEQAGTVGTYSDTVYMFSLLCSLLFSIGIRYCLKHKTHLNQKYDVWNFFAKFPSFRSMLATTLIAIGAAFIGGILNTTHGIFGRAIFCAIFCGFLTAMLTGSPVLFATSAIFTFTGILQSPVCSESMISHKDCWTNATTSGSFDWLLGTPSSSWTEEGKWSHDILEFTFRGLMWTIPLGLPVASYGYSLVLSLSGLVMGFVYNAGSFSTPFPLCMMGISSGIKLGDFYMGAWIFFAVSVCVLGSKRRSSASQACEHAPDNTTLTKAVSIAVEPRTQINCKVLMKTRAVDTDEENLVVATVVGHPVSSPQPSTSTPVDTNTRCRRDPAHGSRAMRCCRGIHLLFNFFLVCTLVLVFFIWLGYFPEQMGEKGSTTTNKAKDDDWLLDWDVWYLWFLAFVLLSCSYHARRGNRRRCCYNSSGQ